MGQKTHPIGFRLGLKKNWQSKWFSSHNFKDFLIEDIKIRKFLNKKLEKMGLSRIEIERSAKKTKVHLYVSKPGLVIGRGGTGIDNLRQELSQIVKDKKIQLAVAEVKSPFLSAKIIANEMVGQLERRMPEKRIINSMVEKVMGAGAKGVKVAIKGRIAGQEIARNLYKVNGSIPLQNMSADIDFAIATAFTKYGTMGIKVWIYKGIPLTDHFGGSTKKNNVTTKKN